MSCQTNSSRSLIQRICVFAVLGVATAVIFALEWRETLPERIVAAITRNQRSIGSLTAYISCRCSKEALSFDRGFLRLKESNKIGMWRGSRNSQVWSNATCFNVVDPIDNCMYGYLWNDSSGKQQTFWGLKVGYKDVNAALEAVTQARDFEIAVDDEVVNGIPCFKLAWSGNRLWVDANNFAQVLKWESDYSDGTLASRADYDEWTTMGTVQLPMKLSFEQFYDSGKYSWRRFDFVLSEVNVGADVDDAYFVVWTPPDSRLVPGL